MAILNTIVPMLCQCIIPEDLNKIFIDSSHSLWFVTKTILIKKNLEVASKPITAEIQAHTNKMLGKLANFATKHIASEVPPSNIKLNMMSKSTSSVGTIWSLVTTLQTASTNSLPKTKNPTPGNISECPSDAECRFALLETSIF
jgi:hypothetical protein